MKRVDQAMLSGVLVLASSLAHADPGDELGWAQAHMWGGGMGMFGMGGLTMLVFWGAIVALIVLAVRGWNGDERRIGPTAMDILQEQFVRGEIDEATYRQRKAVLHG